MQESVPPRALLDLSCLLFCQSCASMLHLNVSLQRRNHHTVDLYAPPNPNCTPFAFQCFLWGNCSALLYPFHFKNGVPFPYLMPVAPHSYFYKALGMASAGSVLIKSMSSLSHPLPGSPDTSYQLIHCFGLSMKNLPKASGTVWGSCRTLEERLSLSKKVAGETALRFYSLGSLPVLFRLPVLPRSKQFKQHTHSYHPLPCLPITTDFVLSNHELKSTIVTSGCCVRSLING